MFSTFSRFTGALTLALCLAGASSATATDGMSITLRAVDGGIAVSGKLISFDGASYVVATQLGEMVLSADQVTCDGLNCPSSPSDANENTVTLAIGADLAPGLVPLLVESYAVMAQSPLVRSLTPEGHLSFRLNGEAETRIQTLPQAPGFAFGAMSEGRADITLTRQQPGTDIVAVASLGAIERVDAPANQQILALDALSVVVSAANPVRQLDQNQIKDIFAGRIANWSALGGPNAPINLFMIDPSEALSARISDRVLEADQLAANTQYASSAAAVSDKVASDRYAIGITTFSNMRGATPVSLLTQCGLTMTPTPAAIMTETYPFSERIFAYSAAGDAKAGSADLLTYLQGNAAQDAVNDAGFVGQRIATLSLDAQGQRFISAMLNHSKRGQSDVLRELLREIGQADRLTPTYRFLSGGAQLDQKAEADVERLAQYINSRDFSNREILFVGFTDSVGSTSRNRKLSKQRAEQIQKLVLARIDPEKRAELSFAAMGFGEIAPLACNESAAGQSANRRVEIWLRPRG